MNCDALAPHYARIEHAAFGSALEACRAHFLPELSHAYRILVLGDGDGRFLRGLLEANRTATVDYIDLSAGMLARARAAADGDRVHYRQGDALSIDLEHGAYDAVATHFFLDCFGPDEICALAHRVRQACTPGATWVVSEFQVPQGWLSGPAHLLISAMYLFFGLATGLRIRRLTDHRPLLVESGFRLIESSPRLRGLLSSELWSMTP